MQIVAQIPHVISYILLFLALYFEVFLLITYFGMGKESKVKKTLPAKLPSVSILVPCWNEATTISATIYSLLELNYPKEKLNILIIDDGSTDGTFAEIQKFADNPQIKLLQKENGGKHTALNYALQFVETDMVGCLDADSFVDPEALKLIVAQFTSPDIMAVTPSIKVHNPTNILEKIQKVEYGWGVLFRNILSRLGAIYVTPGPFSIFKREVFTKLGGYREAHKTEDMEIALRLQVAGYKIGNAPDAFIYTVAPKSVKALYKQRLRWTYGFIKNVIDYKQIFFRPQFGNLGLIVLPAASLSIFSSLFMVGTLITGWISKIYHALIQYQVAGINWDWSPSLNLFTINTDIVALLAAIGFLGTITMLVISRKMSEGRLRFGMDIIYFLTLYTFLVPLWMGKAVYNVVFARDTNWR